VANISPGAIIQLAPEFRRVLRADGMLLASGFELNEVDQVQQALGHFGDVRHKGTWALIAMQPN
jgi:ribosomal protein L11 methylase PrmA